MSKNKNKKGFFKKLKKKFDKIDPKIKPFVLVGIVLTVALIIFIIAFNIIKKFKIPSSDELFKEFINQYNSAGTYTESVSITTDTGIELEFEGNISEDADTTHMEISYNNLPIELYVDTLDRKYQVYINYGNGWNGYVASKYTAIDDERTEYIEKDGFTTSEQLTKSDIHNTKVVKNSDGTYDLIFEAKYNRAESLLGQTIFAVRNTAAYKDLETYFNMYQEDIKVRITAHFNHNKKLTAWKMESDPEYAKKANESYGPFNLSNLCIMINNLDYKSIDVYVPVSVDVEAFKTNKTS